MEIHESCQEIQYHHREKVDRSNIIVEFESESAKIL